MTVKTIELGRKRGGRKGIAIVDDQDFDRVNAINWYPLRSTNSYTDYAYNVIVGLMHRFILDVPSEVSVDHINRNGLDNRRENLRPASVAQNQQNRKKAQGTSSKYKGVSWNKERQLWHAYIHVSGRMKYLGRFQNEVEAALVYDDAARLYFGEFARCNFQ